MSCRKSIKSMFTIFALALGCTALGAGAYASSNETTADMLCQNEVFATVVSNTSLKANGPETDLQAVITAAIKLYDKAAAEQALPTADQIKAMDRAFQDAENKVNLVAPLKYKRTLQLRKLAADVLDRLIWGGSLFALGWGASWLACKLKRATRMIRCVSMVAFGCAYALLLPIIAVAVVGAWLFFPRRFNLSLPLTGVEPVQKTGAQPRLETSS